MRPVMTKAKFFLLSLLVGVLAVASQLMWMHHVSQSVRTIAISAGATEAERASARAESNQLLQSGQPFWYLGVGLAACSFILWFLCLSRREPVWRSIPLIPLVSYLLLQLTLI